MKYLAPFTTKVTVLVDTDTGHTAQVGVNATPFALPDNSDLLRMCAGAVLAVRNAGHPNAQLMSPREASEFYLREMTGRPMAIGGSPKWWEAFTKEELEAEIERQATAEPEEDDDEDDDFDEED